MGGRNSRKYDVAPVCVQGPYATADYRKMGTQGVMGIGAER